MDQQPSNENPWKALFLVTAIGVDFALCVTAGLFAGRWLSDKAGGNPLWLILGLAIGIGAGVATVILLVKPFVSEGKNE